MIPISPFRVLVADDYQEHADTLVSTFKLYGSEAFSCNSGKEALALYRQHEPALVVCDEELSDGMKAWRFIHDAVRHRFKNEIYRPYFVVLSSSASQLQRRVCEECGADRYLAKPIELSTLLAWVGKARERVTAADQARKHGTYGKDPSD